MRIRRQSLNLVRENIHKFLYDQRFMFEEILLGIWGHLGNDLFVDEIQLVYETETNGL